MKETHEALALAGAFGCFFVLVWAAVLLFLRFGPPDDCAPDRDPDHEG